MDLEHFCSLVVGDAVEKAEEKLMQGWYPKVTSLFSGEEGVGRQVTHSSSFNSCVSTLISNHVSRVGVCVGEGEEGWGECVGEGEEGWGVCVGEGEEGEEWFIYVWFRFIGTIYTQCKLPFSELSFPLSSFFHPFCPFSLLLFPSSLFLLLSLPPPFFPPSSFSPPPPSFPPSSLPLSQICDLLVRTIEAYVSLYDPNNTTRLPQFKLQLCLEEATSPSPPEGETHTEKDLAEGEDKDARTEAREEGEKEPQNKEEKNEGEKNEGEKSEGEKNEGEQGAQTVVQRFEFYPSLSDLEAAVLSVVDTVGGAMKQVPDVKVRVWTVH